ncbi:MAG: bifunctional 4-hydroxy-2-oxoglutarate aldolase/2-dehydro-3-deoxy-phosphogluconate aldolase [Proteobacteria bacterium]|nr:bifunctional 4-hydroxy-2-oxoglutarate aldolase/2-dehydro-3-deoxy-phosphogluconate aldolase [Pseudomonadota bacterium]
MDITNVISCNQLLPLATLTSRDQVEPLVNVLINTGLPLVEITLRDERTINILDEFKKHPNITLGVGTIKNSNQIDKAVEAGASFLITPGFTKKLSQYASSKDVLLIPGTQTPSEIMLASEQGHSLLKFFPAELSGGIARLESYNAVFPDIKFIPTGGISEKNASSYLRLDNVIAIGASALIPSELIRLNSWKEIEDRLTKLKTTYLIS